MLGAHALKKKSKVWWQSRVKCVLNTWDFGYAHSLVEGSSSWGSQKPVGSPLAFQGRQQETLSFCSISLSFLPPQSLQSLLRDSTWSLQLHTRGQVDPHSFPSSSALLCQKNCAVSLLDWLPPSLPSLPLPLLASLQLPLLCHLLHDPIHPLLGAQIDGSLRCPGVLCRGTFFGYGCLISCKSKEREKRSESHHRDDDFTPNVPFI